MKQDQNTSTQLFATTGIPGLDEILTGGLTQDRLFLIEGSPGSGKTTLAMQFLLEGARQGERTLYISLAESEVELRSVAASHGWSMDGITVLDVMPDEDILDPAQQTSIFHPGEIEMAETTKIILDAVEKYRPKRVVLDSLSELQLLAPNAFHYRRQILALKHFFSTRSCTVLLLDDKTAIGGDQQVRSIAHGVISLEHQNSDYGAERRIVRVIKYRGIGFRRGPHDYSILTGGLAVYPRIVSADSRELVKRGQISSGLPKLDKLLGGGIEAGTSTFISGPPGTGKSSLAIQFVSAVTQQGQPAAMFIFEESANNLIHRVEGIGIDLHTPCKSGLLSIQQIDPAELSPGQFAHSVCRAADNGAKVIVIDSLNGYLNAMPDVRFLNTHLHEILTYLGQRGVVTFLIGVQQGMVGGMMSSAMDVSYMADNVLILRYFEADGAVHKAISVFKKRGSQHETTLRRFTLSSRGIEVGQVLGEFQGVLTGIPTARASNGLGKNEA
jgi:circadian clock protein KaiC